MQLKESGEMYLETIYVLSQRKGFVRSIDVGEEMGYSKPSVSRAVGILRDGGYITVAHDARRRRGNRDKRRLQNRARHKQQHLCGSEKIP